MKSLLVVCSIILVHIGHTQSITTSFPKDFVGNWSGRLEWAPVAKTTQVVNMELRIQAIKDSVGYYTWNLIYGSPTKDNRPYILRPVDSTKGHWIIDEMNGIVLDQYYVHGKLVGAFSVQGSTIVNSYQLLEDGDMAVEFVSFTSKPIATTGKGDQTSPAVDSYEIRSVQKAILKKSK